MLGVRLEAKVEAELERYAQAMGSSKSSIVRDLIVRHLETYSLDEQMRRASRVAAATDGSDDAITPDMSVWDHA